MSYKEGVRYRCDCCTDEKFYEETLTIQSYYVVCPRIIFQRVQILRAIDSSDHQEKSSADI
jgi:hypothetical protein